MNKKNKEIISLVIFLALILIVGLLPSKPTSAAVTYPVPHRSWIKLGLVAYQSTMTAAQIDWTAKNIDLFDNPHSTFLPQYKAKTDAPMIAYENYYCFYVGDSKYTDMMAWAAAHNLSASEIEDMYVHFAEPTTIAFNGVTNTIPTQSCLDANPTNPRACSRVPSYDWYGNGGDMSKNNSRVILNVGNANYRAFNAEHQVKTLSTNYSGATYDGLFVDNSAPGVLTANGTVSAGGTFAEFPGTRTEGKAAYDAAMVQTFGEVRTALDNAFGARKKIQIPNSSYDNWTAIFPYIDGVFREFMIQPNNKEVSSVETYFQRMTETQAAGIPSIVSAVGLGSTNTDLPREKMTALSMYYLAASSIDYFNRQDKNAGDPQTYAWFGALDYNVGQPKTNQSTLAFGIDPSSPKLDRGEATVTKSGSSYTLTDISGTKNWSSEYWQGTTLIDASNNTFRVWHSGPNWISFYITSGPTPISGNYTIGSFVYKIFNREYNNALMVVKPKPYYSDSELGDPSVTTHQLPTTTDNPTGRYYKLNTDGSIDMTPLTQITLRNAEGVVLIKESALNRPSVLKTVDKASAKSGDPLTYTISYSNSATNTFSNAKLEDPIPSGTTFDAITSGSATYDTVNKKVILNIGNLAAGASGSISFRVIVN